MPYYRCYSLSDATRIVAVAEGSYRDDTVAIQWAETLLRAGDHRDCAGVELWRDACCVHSVMRQEIDTEPGA
jgi:hypothetical protein